MGLVDTFDLVAAFTKVFLVVNVLMLVVAYMSLVERRGSAIIQLRLGPNRVGWFGVLQPIADGIKFLWKEDIVPPLAHRPAFILAPMAAFVAAFMAFAVIPFGGTLVWGGGFAEWLTNLVGLPAEWLGREIPLVIADLDFGVLFLLAVSSMGVYGIMMAGWASNNKYSQLGGLRSSSQMISYELSLALAVIASVVMAGSLHLGTIIDAQTGSLLPGVSGWYLWKNPLGFLLLLVSMFAETNRLPFDLPEAETELVAGYHTEYSSMKFAMFMMAEYVAMVTQAALLVTLYLGGFTVPAFIAGPLGLEGNWLVFAQIGVFFAKVAAFMWLYVWVRWTLPRFRFDQLLHLGWKILIPLGLLNVVWAAALAMMGWA